MPRYDAHHEAVKAALRNDGWTITDDPFMIEYEDVQLFADLGAEKVFGAEKEGVKIVVEIKVLGGASFFNEFHKAVGQYANYRSLLRRTEPERQIYLAVSVDLYESEFQRRSVQAMVEDEKIWLLIFDPSKEEVVQWIQ
jgi:hypothetical protein